jgi:hypothetical protein
MRIAAAVMLNAVKHLIALEQLVPTYSRPPARGVQRPPQKNEGAQDLLKKVRE